MKNALYVNVNAGLSKKIRTEIVRKKNPTKLVRDTIKVFIFMAGKKKKKVAEVGKYCNKLSGHHPATPLDFLNLFVVFPIYDVGGTYTSTSCNVFLSLKNEYLRQNLLYNLNKL